MCMWDNGDESYKVYLSEMRTARKPHSCVECQRVINAGEKHSFAKGLYDGVWDCHRTCAHCSVAQKWLIANCGGFLLEGVWEDLEEHIREYPQLRFSLGRLSIARRRRWMRFDDTGLMSLPPVPPTLEEVGIEHGGH